MVEQVRRMCELETKKTRGSKSVMTLFRKKERKNSTTECDAQEGVIRVQMPGTEKVSNTVQLSDSTTAGDIVLQFTQHVRPSAEVPFKRTSIRRRSRRKTVERNSELSSLISQLAPNRTRYFLYEVGGNIGERCLDPDTNMISLLRVNPSAAWVINAKTNWVKHFTHQQAWNCILEAIVIWQRTLSIGKSYSLLETFEGTQRQGLGQRWPSPPCNSRLEKAAGSLSGPPTNVVASQVIEVCKTCVTPALLWPTWHSYKTRPAITNGKQ